jgi:DNA invertase Pin-like site-specific DNA recombinase
VLTIFAGLSQFERELTRERVMAGLAAACARGRQGGQKSAFTKAALRRGQAATQNRGTSIVQLCALQS